MNYDRTESKPVGSKYHKESYETSWKGKEESYNQPTFEEKDLYRVDEKVKFGEEDSSKFDSYKGYGGK